MSTLPAHEEKTLWSLVAARRSEGWFGERWSGAGLPRGRRVRAAPAMRG